MDEVVAALPAEAWRRVPVAEGSQGPRMYEYAEVWVWFSEEGLPGPRERLLVRRSLGQEPELKYHRSNAPAEVPLEKLAQVRATRWTIEEDIQSAKGECGLDEYETRGWVGWHHHTALSMLALAFLVLQKQRLGEKEPQMTVPEVRALLVHLLEVRGGTWPRSSSGRTGGRNATAGRRPAIASGGSPSAAAASEVVTRDLRCSTRG